MRFIFDKPKATAKIRIVFGILATQSVLNIHGENEPAFRHDLSSLITINMPIDPNLAEKYKHKNIRFVDHHERIINKCKGVYKATISPDLGIPEWERFNYLVLIVNQTNDVRLLVGEENNIYIAALSQPGIMTDRTLFLGPTNAGICFYYQVVRDELRTVVSPFGLQKMIKFKRIEHPSILDACSNLPEVKLGHDANKSLNSFTNSLWYLKNEKKSHDENLIKSHNEKMRQAYGTYVFDDKNVLSKLVFRNVDKWYFVINSETDVCWIEEVNGQLFFVIDSRPGMIDEMFLTFGKSGGGTSFLYKTNSEALSVIFNYAMGFYDDEDMLEERFGELEGKGLFQKKLIFRKTQSISSGRFPTHSRTPNEAFFSDP
jgi:hypothetical protein